MNSFVLSSGSSVKSSLCTFGLIIGEILMLHYAMHLPASWLRGGSWKRKGGGWARRQSGATRLIRLGSQADNWFNSIIPKLQVRLNDAQV